MLAKRFFYVCAGILCLALAYHLGARNASAQFRSPVTGWMATGTGTDNFALAMTPNGDIFTREIWGAPPALGAPILYIGNFWDGPTPATQPTWGQFKSRYRQGAAAAPQDK